MPGRPDSPDEGDQPAEGPSEAGIEAVELCGCTNEQLEAGVTCGQPQCPNAK